MITPSQSKDRWGALGLGTGVFIVITLLIFLGATGITFMMPEGFASTCRIRLDRSLGPDSVDPSQEVESMAYDSSLMLTELETIESEVVLSSVIEDLDLNTRWGKRFLGGEPLRTSESLQVLKAQLELSPIENTRVIEIRAFSEDPEEAAKLANGIAEKYLEFTAAHSEGVKALILDSAYPSLRPVLPNKQLNIALGIVVGVVIGLGCGLLTYWIATKWRRSEPPHRNPQPPKLDKGEADTPTQPLTSLHKRF